MLPAIKVNCEVFLGDFERLNREVVEPLNAGRTVESMGYGGG